MKAIKQIQFHFLGEETVFPRERLFFGDVNGKLYAIIEQSANDAENQLRFLLHIPYPTREPWYGEFFGEPLPTADPDFLAKLTGINEADDDLASRIPHDSGLPTYGNVTRGGMNR